MPGADLQVVAHQPAQRVEDGGRRRRVEAVAAVVDPQPGHLERAGQPADRLGPVDDDDLVAGERGPPGGGQAGGAGADDPDHLAARRAGRVGAAGRAPRARRAGEVSSLVGRMFM